jgi:hypothetical protein
MAFARAAAIVRTVYNRPVQDGVGTTTIIQLDEGGRRLLKLF